MASEGFRGGERAGGSTRRRAAHAGSDRLRVLGGVAGGVYLLWWFAVERLLPGSFNPFLGRAVVVLGVWLLVGATYLSDWVDRHFSALFTAWVCALVAHYDYLVVGNRGESTWWVGAFVTFAASAMCVPSRAQVLAFSIFSLGSAAYVAAVLGQLGNSIYVPGLATIVLLANLTKRSQTIAEGATLEAARARQDEQRADEQRRQLAAIVESSGDAIVGTDLSGVVRSWNKGAERLFGHAAEDVIGRRMDGLLHPDGQSSDPPDGDEPAAPFEASRRRKDGSEVDVSMTMSPIRDARGEVVGASIVARDISDRKRAESATLRAREAAEAANRELEAFNYSVAHDLRAPLRGIDGFTHVLLEDYGQVLDDEGKQHLGRVRDAARHMGRLIDGLLALSRVAQGDLSREPVDLSGLARDAAERLKQSGPDRDVEFVIDDGLTVRGDGRLLCAAIENLLANAWKFTRDRQRARIEFGAVRRGTKNDYFVRDNGAGFDMAYAGKLFGVFQRLHAESEYEGTGIGLATVQRIVQRHGGRIWAEAKVGEGACFYFTLHD